jgi:HK97 family phage major capsid protein
MALLLAEAEKLSNNWLIASIIEEIITIDEVFARLPFVGFTGKTYTFNREKTLPTAAFKLPNAVLTETAGTFDEIDVKLKAILDDVQVDSFIETQLSDLGSQAAKQVQLASKAVGRAFSDKFINGDQDNNLGGGAKPEEFNGLRSLLASAAFAAQIATTTGALSFAMLDELVDICKKNMNRAFLMHSRTIRSFYELCRNLGGTDPVHITVPGITGPVPTYRGIPILKNEYIPINLGQAGTLTQLFCASFDEDEGVHGLMPRTNAGIVVEEVGIVEGADARRYRVKWYASATAKSTKSVSVANSVTN